MKNRYVIGIDYGSDSARGIILDSETGAMIAEKAYCYKRWKNGWYCNPSIGQYRQHPKDYLEALEQILRGLWEQVGEEIISQVAAIAFDTTGSTVCPVDQSGVPLSLKEEFAEEPDAMFLLWKDHTSVEEAHEITQAFSEAPENFTRYQGEYSAEWFWAKILHVARANKRICKAAWVWVEQSDWMAGLLAGRTAPGKIVRNACAAGHKALWNTNFGGLPNRDILERLDPYLGDIYDRYEKKTSVAGTVVGNITSEWSKRLHLAPECLVVTGSFDAHAGAVAAGVSEHTLVKVVGTSSVDMTVLREVQVENTSFAGACGLAQDSIIPGYYGCETSQSAFGDSYAWLKNFLLWPIKHLSGKQQVISEEMLKKLIAYMEEYLISIMEKAAEKLEEEDHITALDWFNGRRYPVLNESVRSAIAGLTLGTNPAEVYRALVKATVFGTKSIIMTLKSKGVSIERIICTGGIACKSPYVMQTMADALNMPIMISKLEQGCARGAAIYAAVGAGIYSSIEEAQKYLCEPYAADYYPRLKQVKYLEEQYKEYLYLGGYAESIMRD